ncbi:MAG: hypothetical protein LBL95_04730 [Deltaproteobacteria bacterium]|jgi:hypothetical protein|nr:hypothetical protein [Deltaproteobacteria bacterium]
MKDQSCPEGPERDLILHMGLDFFYASYSNCGIGLRREGKSIPACSVPEWQARYLAGVITMPDFLMYKLFEENGGKLNILAEMVKTLGVNLS